MSFIPNTIPTPAWLYNGEMKKMSDTELRVVLVVTRQTLGWIENKETGMRKTEDWISQKQLVEKTGRSNRAISTAINNCIKNRWIEARDKTGNLLKTPEKRSGNKVFYRLGNIFTDKLKTSEDSSQVKKPVNLTTPTSELNDTKPVKIVHSTKETLTKETIQKENSFLFSLFKEKINPKAKFLDGAKSKLKTRLKTFTSKEIEKAIINFSKDEGKMKNIATNSFAWFLFSDDRVETYVNLKQKKDGDWR